jgi:hypothetical protein
MRSFSISYLALLTAGAICPGTGLNAAPPVLSPIPLEKGNRWIFEGKIETTLTGSSKVYTTNICWAMEVVDSNKSTNVQAAIVRGFPDELPWFEPGHVPGYCVLLNFSNRVYQLKMPDEKEATETLKNIMIEPGKFSTQAQDYNELYALPLAKGKRWGGDTKREDGWYCWRVEKVKQETLHIEGESSNQTTTTYALAYRCNPEHELVDIVPGLGITRFVYMHHGTVASVDVRLVSFEHLH